MLMKPCNVDLRFSSGFLIDARHDLFNPAVEMTTADKTQ